MTVKNIPSILLICLAVVAVSLEVFVYYANQFSVPGTITTKYDIHSFAVESVYFFSNSTGSYAQVYVRTNNDTFGSVNLNNTIHQVSPQVTIVNSGSITISTPQLPHGNMQTIGVVDIYGNSAQETWVS